MFILTIIVGVMIGIAIGLTTTSARGIVTAAVMVSLLCVRIT